MKFTAILLSALALLSCSNGISTPSAPPSLAAEQTSEAKARLMATMLQDPYWQKRWWLEKTARFFRGGKGLSPTEDIESLMRLPEEEILRKFTADSRFALTVLDFNMYLLGFKSSEIHLDRPGEGAYDFPQAVSSAKAVLEGGDYFTLFGLHHPFYFGPQTINRGEDDDQNAPDGELLRRRGEQFKTELVSLIEYTSDPQATAEEACKRLGMAVSASPYARLGDFRVSNLLFQTEVFNASFLLCQDQSNRKASDLIAPTQKLLSVHEQLIPQLVAMAKENYQPKGIGELLPLKLPAEILDPKQISYGLAQRINLPNSSTNFNRRRAAYVLKRFFCDDLTPIAVENPTEHTDGKHGSQTSCYACHYKLDPMAGYFRNHGVFFFDFTGAPKIRFDDGAQADLPAYLENWRAKPGHSREWEVGYVRSINKEELNDYGDTLEDLYALMRRAPEVKRCIVKRMFQYFNSEDQTLDGGYLDYLSQEFETRSAENSAAAFRWVASQLALGNTYRNPDPAPTDCYDYKPGHRPGQSPPCRVAHILQKNCAGCHSSVFGAGELDLSGWITGPDGKMTFPHERNGQQLTLRHTIEKIISRISAADPRMRMPLSREMSSQERQELYLWAQEQLSGAGK